MEQKDQKVLTRREVISGLGVAMTAAALSSLPAFAQGVTKNAESTKPKQDLKPLRDPATLYPKPPFSAQSQKWPGLASKAGPLAQSYPAWCKADPRLQGSSRRRGDPPRATSA